LTSKIRASILVELDRLGAEVIDGDIAEDMEAMPGSDELANDITARMNLHLEGEWDLAAFGT